MCNKDAFKQHGIIGETLEQGYRLRDYLEANFFINEEISADAKISKQASLLIADLLIYVARYEANCKAVKNEAMARI